MNTAETGVLFTSGVASGDHSRPSAGSAVYVDACEWPYGRMMMCHMLADRVEDLHAMADKIGVDRRWFQNKRYPHYDICKAKRALAVKFGAVEIGRREFVALAKRLMNPPNVQFRDGEDVRPPSH